MERLVAHKTAPNVGFIQSCIYITGPASSKYGLRLQSSFVQQFTIVINQFAIVIHGITF
jgi:hypothetical protein